MLSYLNVRVGFTELLSVTASERVSMIACMEDPRGGMSLQYKKSCVKRVPWPRPLALNPRRYRGGRHAGGSIFRYR